MRFSFFLLPNEPNTGRGLTLNLVQNSHEFAKLDKPNRLNLVYTLEGEESDLKPLVLTAHQVRHPPYLRSVSDDSD